MKLSSLASQLMPAVALFLFSSITITAQTTAFTYQGHLSDSAVPGGNGTYTMKFRLYDSVINGNLIGTEQTASVTVNNFTFTTMLDFTATPITSGLNRWLEIQVGATTLAPRQRLTSAPYAIRSLSAASADSAPPTAGSGNYVQNTTSPQATSNFNISGNGTAGGTLSGTVVNSATQYNTSGDRVFISDSGTSNLFAGKLAGPASVSGINNSFFGITAGNTNTGSHNTFIGVAAGQQNTAGTENAFFGAFSGTNNQTGNSNTMLGANANPTVTNISFATAIGAGTFVGSSNSVVIGRNVDRVGIGVLSPLAKVHIKAGSGNIMLGDSGCVAGGPINGIGFGTTLTCNNYSIIGEGLNTFVNRATGGSLFFREGNVDQLIIKPGGVIAIASLGSIGTPQATLCRNSSGEIAFCSSSLRYKTNVEPLKEGLDLIRKFRPVSFDWKNNRQADIGLIAEEVAEIEPRLAYKNHNGEIEGVSYSQISVVLINAMKEQQAQIEEQKTTNQNLQMRVDQQQDQINGLIKLICLGNQKADVCQQDGQ